MNSEKSKNIIIIILTTIIVILIVLCILALNGNIGLNKNNNQVEENDINNQIQDDNNNNKEQIYNLGDSIVITKLSSIDLSIEGKKDFSNWHVLEDDGEYLTLMSDNILYKESQGILSPLSRTKETFENNGINFGTNGEIRLINEEDLTKYFGCNLNNLTCTPTNSWLSNLNSPYTSTLTSVTREEQVIIINFDYTLELGQKENVLYPIFPIIKILKNSI